jgi:hypothetical protein
MTFVLIAGLIVLGVWLVETIAFLAGYKLSIRSAR